MFSMYCREKLFMTIFIPVAVAIFFSVPVLTLKALFMTDIVTVPLTPSFNGISSIFSLQTEPREEEIPLVFIHEKYPNQGSHRIHLHSAKYLKLAEKLQNESKQRLGFIYIFDAKGTQDLPTGELLNINGFDWREDGCFLNTERERSFRIKSVRKDRGDGVLYAVVQWLDK